jgi:hypothetical protein
MSVTERLTGSSGHVAFCGRKNQFAIDNVLDGFDLYQLDKGQAQLLRILPTRPSTVRTPKQVAFCEEGKVVIGGSDHGVVYAFDRRSGQTLDKLPHPDSTMVQTISAKDTGEATLIGTASSTNQGRISICIWIRKTPRIGRDNVKKKSSFMGILWAFVQLGMAIATARLFYESVKDLVSVTM